MLILPFVDFGRVAKIGCALILCLFISSSCRADNGKSTSDRQRPKPRSWTEVKFEIDEAFDFCSHTNKKIWEQRKPGSPLTGGRSSYSIHGEQNVLEMVFNRHPSDRPEEKVIILDIRVERDYSPDLGQATSFRIVRNIAQDEGLLMLKEMVSFFEKKKWPYEIVEPKKQKKEVR